MLLKGLGLLVWVSFVHLAGIYLFIQGFLLSRLSLSDVTQCLDGSCTIPPTHKKAVVLIIDALRYDFLTPEPPNPPSPFHHDVLTLPRELTAANPGKSFLFNAFSDPPTTTLQRIKGLTTGSLPTFIDMGSNFGASSIDEDSIIHQLRAAGKKIAFMGDDTWTMVFPDSFEPNMTFPYDSFNVEDLHTVDEGVIRHLFPLLDKPASWDFIIGHFLGVDHAGHRLGPDHPTMKAKLAQMNEVLTRVVDRLDEDTLLVLLGDHGMDRKGDHGGDSELETSCGVWIYSKGPILSNPSSMLPQYLLEPGAFPRMTEPHRGIQQIDLVPSLSLLLGLPIPFNNLGTVIPELFWRDTQGSLYTRALELNAAQIETYLNTYRSSSSGGELDTVWPVLRDQWSVAKSADQEGRVLALKEYSRLALSSCRLLWAQFNKLFMGLGLALLVLGVIAPWALYSWLARIQDSYDESVDKLLTICLRGLAVGSILGVIGYLGLYKVVPEIDALNWMLFDAPLMSCIAVVAFTRPSFSLAFSLLKSIPVPLILHTLAFFSNSFTVWEDHIVLYLLISSLVPLIGAGVRAPTSRLRRRILGFTALFALCVRLMAISTVCREEQHPYCHVTFFSSASLPSPPTLVLALVVPISIVLPWICKRFLAISKSDNGVASFLLPWMLPAVLLAGNGYWILEWVDSVEVLGNKWSPLLRGVRTLLARSAMGGVLLGGLSLWWLIPLCIRVDTTAGSEGPHEGKAETKNKQVTVLGFANAFGSPYFVFWMIFLGLLFVVTQLTGQVMLLLATLALLAYLEVVDSVRDAKGLTAAFASARPSIVLDLEKVSAPLQFSDIVPLYLLAIHTFHATGHQSTIPSIQWKTAFVLSSTLTYPFSPGTVALNTFGPQFLLALAGPLLGLWNLPPLPQPDARRIAVNNTVRMCLAMMVCFGTLLLGSAVSAAWLRRHLMVWKIFAPRFMSAAAQLVAVDLALLVGYGIGVVRIVRRVSDIFRGMS
ncbi:hypothetical protein NEOLEDRAFT_318498 [Neolentinus lepideus HHB14362 ss-1]|uniref:Uncharacterized protein n=1 Tax=Neolentinus lepideus HHB14362 ss-1 TaxID=1314782 RepID=A0A165VUP1_9AGAM|nr:hypothetical protein NEOLEDRAFT_318498 [Neolentinus lepideus HHB14362 ss-1]